MPIIADGALPNKILIGKNPDAPLYSYGNADLSIGSIKGTFNCDIISNELPIDTFSFGVYYDENQERVYLTKDTRQAYASGNTVPGTLESSGWYEIDDSATNYAEIDGNTMTLKPGSSYHRIRIRPPASVVPNRYFQQGDKIVVALDVIQDYAKVGINQWGALEYKNGTFTSETGFFVKRSSDEYELEARCTGTGKDVLTFNLSQGQIRYLQFTPLDSDGTPLIDAYATIVVTGLKYNGTVIFGKVEDIPPTVYVLSNRGNVPAKKYLKNIKYGTPVWWFCDDYLQGKGYLKTVERTGTNTWKIVCMSAIGLLDEKIHTGGYYTGQTFDTVLKEIVGNSFKYEYATGNESIADLAVFGWLPYDTARNNLHRLLFSMGATIKRVDNQ